MKLSVCIPSYNPTVALTATIDSLVSQNYLIDQLVIIIDNNNYAKQVEEFKKKYSGVFNLSITMQANTGRAGARNNCVKIATGDIILFLDDDMITEGNLVKKHIDYHAKEGECVVSGSGFHDPSKAKTSFAKYVLQSELSWQKNIPADNRVTMENFAFTACNMSMPAGIFNRLGGFDSRLKDAEDFDFGVRALDKGVKIFYDKDIKAWHNDSMDLKQTIRRYNEYKIANAALLNLHPDYHKRFPHFIPVAPRAVKRVMKWIFRHIFAPFVLSDLFIFRVLPLNAKFTLYRLTIAANLNEDGK